MKEKTNPKIRYDKRQLHNPEYFIAAVQEAVKWIDSREISDEYGIKWQYNDSPEAVEYYTNEENFNSGSSGMIPYLLSVYDATGIDEYLNKAVAVGDRLIATKDTEHVRVLGNHLVGFPWSIYGGLPGEAATAIMLYEKTGYERFRDFAVEVADDICKDAVITEYGVKWSGESRPAVGGDGGTVLFLLYLSRHLNTDQYREMIQKGAAQLLTYGKKNENGNKVWKYHMENGDGTFSEVDMPGVEFGASGMAWILAELYEYLGDSALLDAAMDYASYVKSISVEVAPNSYLAYLDENNPTVYYLGNCMGAAGTIKMFYRLYQITGDEIHKDWLEKYVNGILSTGAPVRRSPGYWNNDCVCCGTAGLLRMFLGLWAEFGSDEYMRIAEDAAETLLANGFNDDKSGLRWYHAFERVSPMKVHTHTGFMCGNAGAVTALIEYYLAKQGNYHAYRFIEDPLADRVRINRNTAD